MHFPIRPHRSTVKSVAVVSEERVSSGNPFEDHFLRLVAHFRGFEFLEGFLGSARHIEIGKRHELFDFIVLLVDLLDIFHLLLFPGRFNLFGGFRIDVLFGFFDFLGVNFLVRRFFYLFGTFRGLLFRFFELLGTLFGNVFDLFRFRLLEITKLLRFSRREAPSFFSLRGLENHLFQLLQLLGFFFHVLDRFRFGKLFGTLFLRSVEFLDLETFTLLGEFFSRLDFIDFFNRFCRLRRGGSLGLFRIGGLFDLLDEFYLFYRFGLFEIFNILDILDLYRFAEPPRGRFQRIGLTGLRRLRGFRLGRLADFGGSLGTYHKGTALQDLFQGPFQVFELYSARRFRSFYSMFRDFAAYNVQDLIPAPVDKGVYIDLLSRF